MEPLEKLLADARQVLRQYEEAERNARNQLDQIIQGRLMQAGAVRGVEMAIQTLAANGQTGAGVEDVQN